MTSDLHTQTQEALDKYLQNYDSLLAEATAAVVEWKYAEDEHFNLLPLSDEIGLRGDNQWYPAKVHWLPDKQAGICYEHGFDADGRLRIVRWGALTTLVMYHADTIDQMQYRDGKEGGRGLCRAVLQGGRVTMCCTCTQKTYACETFEYEGDRPIRSTTRRWSLKDGQWEEAKWVAVSTYEHDEHGLLRAYHDMGIADLGSSLVYVRPGAGCLHQQAQQRRPMIAYQRTPNPEEEEPGHDIYCDAYGLEMNFNPDWPVDIVLLTAPNRIKSITRDTDVTKMGNVAAGASGYQTACDLWRIRRAGGQWVLLDNRHAAKLAKLLRGSLGLLWYVEDVAELQKALANIGQVNPQHLVVALRAAEGASPDAVQTAAAKVRQELTSRGGAACRVLIAAELDKGNVIDYVSQADIDGVFFPESRFDEAMEVIVPIALESRRCSATL